MRSPHTPPVLAILAVLAVLVVPPLHAGLSISPSPWSTIDTNLFYLHGNIGVGTSTPTNGIDSYRRPYAFTSNTGSSNTVLRILNSAGAERHRIDYNNDTGELTFGSLSPYALSIDTSARIAVGTNSHPSTFNVQAQSTASVATVISGLSTDQTGDILRLAKYPGASPGLTYSAAGTLALNNYADADFLDSITISAGLTGQYKRYLDFLDYSTGLSDWRLGANRNDDFILYDSQSTLHTLISGNTALSGGVLLINANGPGAIKLNSDTNASAGGFQVWSGGAAPAPWVTISNGCLGIATATPTNGLELYRKPIGYISNTGSSNTVLRILNSAYAERHRWDYDNDTGELTLGGLSPNVLSVDTSARVAIGTNYHDATLNVQSRSTAMVGAKFTGLSSSQTGDILQLAKYPGIDPTLYYTAGGVLALNNRADADFLNAITISAGLAAQYKRYMSFVDYSTGNSDWLLGANANDDLAIFDSTSSLHSFLSGSAAASGGILQINANGPGPVRVNSETNASAGGFQVWSGGASPAQWYTVTNGNVGIGTNTPAARLSVNGNPTGLAFEVNTNQLVLTNGKVGIGTAGPTMKLELSDGAANGSFRIGADVNATTLSASTRKIGRIVSPNYTSAGTGTNIFLIGGDANGSGNFVNIGGVVGGTPYAATAISFVTGETISTSGGTERMIINNLGKVGIGTAAPLFGLDINEASGNALRLIYNDADGSPAYYAYFNISAAGNLTITPSGGLTTASTRLVTPLFGANNAAITNNLHVGTNGTPGTVYIRDGELYLYSGALLVGLLSFDAGPDAYLNLWDQNGVLAIDLRTDAVSTFGNGITSSSVNSTNAFSHSGTNGINSTIDVLVAGGTTNRLVFSGGILISNIVSY